MSVDAGSSSPIDVARTVADAARAHDDVLDLDYGLAGEFATYGLGGRVPGVRVEVERDGRTRVQLRLVVRFGRPIPDIGDEVRSKVAAALGPAADPDVHVHVADITTAAPASAPPELEPPGVP